MAGILTDKALISFTRPAESQQSCGAGEITIKNPSAGDQSMLDKAHNLPSLWVFDLLPEQAQSAVP
ncbi:MAG: hypothetical protein KUG52_01600 [Immundisolibacteraceae bacterium]|nr:hypothetical protein [Immundisolibacteraceae bacterium]